MTKPKTRKEVVLKKTVDQMVELMCVWIAEHDDPVCNVADEIENYTTVAMVSDLFNVPTTKIAARVVELRDAMEEMREHDDWLQS